MNSFINIKVKHSLESEWLFDEKPADWVISYWMHNLERIKDLVANGSDYLNISMVSTYALGEAISFNLFGKSSRYYYKNILKIPNAHLLHEIFRNGFTHSFKPNRIQYDDCLVTWAWSSDTSPSGFRDFYFGEVDSETGEKYFEDDEIVEYVDFNGKTKQFSITLDRLLARIEADLKERKNLLKEKNKFYFISGKRIKERSPSGAINFKSID
jgi:hypothetical protein